MKLKKILSLVVATATLLAALVCAIPASADAVQVPEILGASIRLDDPQGLRFVARIAKAGAVTLVEGGDDVNFGIILMPQSATPALNTALTVATEDVMIVPAKKTLTEANVTALGLSYDDDYVYFSAALTNIPECYYYVDNFVAKAYVFDGVNYTYSFDEDGDEAGNTLRSIETIATAIENDADASVEAKGFATAALAVCEAPEITDILVDWETLFPAE